MGLYAIDCPQCLKPFMWFSGNRDQRCDDCRHAEAAQKVIIIAQGFDDEPLGYETSNDNGKTWTPVVGTSGTEKNG